MKSLPPPMTPVRANFSLPSPMHHCVEGGAGRQHLSDLPGANRYLHPPAFNVRSRASFHHPKTQLLCFFLGSDRRAGDSDRAMLCSPVSCTRT
ncbi:hypothetical protein NPIL_696301 [Nephila pilipes]|uniref:Uncharacterized protein n=1 Tax=Nephila pilipes TaxID=299642 RepID=A0A8X6ITZ8_NEPPI|nr:hypothetical protein NPIL_696301 [Nephila pilipes]